MIYLPRFLFCVFFIPFVYGFEKGLQTRQATLTGDTQCGTFMCIAATVNGSTTSYVLSGLGKDDFGWMAMGFGRQMTNTPMVIMWTNIDGSVTLSQRSASREEMPTVVANPPRVAALSMGLSVVSTTTPQLAFIIPTNGDSSQSVIYAYGSSAPSSSAVDATLLQHVDYGVLQLNLAKQLPSGTTVNPPVPTDVRTGGSVDIPLKPYQRLIVAHAVFCAVGFLIFLPAGALLARYLRTFTTTWFKGHWILQFAISGPTILVGVSLGIRAVAEANAMHLDDNHKRWGIAIFVLYLVQCSLGAVIHFFKRANRTRRPPQNYVHAIFGLLIIGLALYQVHSGYSSEWQNTTGRDPPPRSVSIVFYIWVALLPLLYAAGLSFLPKQIRQESKNNHAVSEDDDRNNFNLSQSEYRTRK
ncbi:hypothetical protein B0H34DRAFT_699258 [Crassisporium funariophilum]|nr:hypothetical protein B0H34DRAFT_699258 [Crassisporium funariophilum]